MSAKSWAHPLKYRSIDLTYNIAKKKSIIFFSPIVFIWSATYTCSMHLKAMIKVIEQGCTNPRCFLPLRYVGVIQLLFLIGPLSLSDM